MLNLNKKLKSFKRKNKTKIVSLTAYSKNTAKILDKYCDIILVGDSMANVLYAFKNTHKLDLKHDPTYLKCQTRSKKIIINS